jgi:hypothetical protein
MPTKQEGGRISIRPLTTMHYLHAPLRPGHGPGLPPNRAHKQDAGQGIKYIKALKFPGNNLKGVFFYGTLGKSWKKN